MSESLPSQDSSSPVTAKGPSLKCPGCSRQVSLPASVCPACGTNLRTGELAFEEPIYSNKPKIIIGLAVVILIIGLGFFIMAGLKDEPEPAASVPPAHKAGDVGEAVDIFHDLQDQSLGATPGIILDRSKNTAEDLDAKRQELDDLFQATEQ